MTPTTPRHERLRLLDLLTGLAQINGRNSLHWAERIELDCHWARSASALPPEHDVDLIEATILDFASEAKKSEQIGRAA